MAKARNKSSKRRGPLPREIPDAERQFTLTEDQKKAIERALQQPIPDVERAARDIPIGRPPERPVPIDKAGTEPEPTEKPKTEPASAPISASTPAEASWQRHGRQIDRVLRALLIHYPPHGKVPRQETIDSVHAKLSPSWKAENKQHGLIDPSWDTINAAVKQVGRRDD